MEKFLLASLNIFNKKSRLVFLNAKVLIKVLKYFFSSDNSSTLQNNNGQIVTFCLTGIDATISNSLYFIFFTLTGNKIQF